MFLHLHDVLEVLFTVVEEGKLAEDECSHFGVFLICSEKVNFVDFTSVEVPDGWDTVFVSMGQLG